MQTLAFRYFGRVGHFMRAEMNASALSYPVPPRTALLGLLGAILGLPKDAVSTVLADAAVGLRIRESMPVRHYHKANVRKRTGIINPISVRLKPAKSGTVWDETSDWGRGAASQVTQEWLLDPDFDVFVASSEHRQWFDDLTKRFQTDIPACHFTPCLGTAWMIARLEKQHIGAAIGVDQLFASHGWLDRDVFAARRLDGCEQLIASATRADQPQVRAPGQPLRKLGDDVMQTLTLAHVAGIDDA